MKRHDWKQTIYQAGHKQMKCRRCGAEKNDYSISIKYGGYHPATLNGKRQPYCSK